MSTEAVEELAEEGVTRILVATTPGSLDQQLDQMSAFAQRMGLSS